MVEWNSISYLPPFLYFILSFFLSSFFSFFYFVELLQCSCNYCSFSWGTQENNEERGRRWGVNVPLSLLPLSLLEYQR